MIVITRVQRPGQFGQLNGDVSLVLSWTHWLSPVLVCASTVGFRP